MRIRVLGGGWYGCHLSTALLEAGHEVELHEIAGHLFAGASGGNPARLHLGYHYPRSKLTRDACQAHHAEFMEVYGALTRLVPTNHYAIAAHASLLDFGTYCQVLRDVPGWPVEEPTEWGLVGVEGALQVRERHILIDQARRHFTERLGRAVRYFAPAYHDIDRFDWTIDCTFCAQDATTIDRYEPCLMVLLEGPTDRAVTIMDGPFPSIYPWDEPAGLCSLTSASLTPWSKQCRTWVEAKQVLDGLSVEDVTKRSEAMLDQMASFWPAARERYRIVDHKLTIRAMPKSAADARLVEVVQTGVRLLQVRAGKIDAVFQAARAVQAWIAEPVPVRRAS